MNAWFVRLRRDAGVYPAARFTLEGQKKATRKMSDAATDRYVRDLPIDPHVPSPIKAGSVDRCASQPRCMLASTPMQRRTPQKSARSTLAGKADEPLNAGGE